MSQLENKVAESKENFTVSIKRHIYDWVSVLIIIGILAASLNIFKFADFSNGQTFLDFIAGWVPFFIATVLLNDNQYRKGIYTGKQTESYKNAVEDYSKEAGALDGKQIESLDDFCNDTNSRVLEKLQKNVLMQQCISYEQFNNGFTKGNKQYEPLKIYDKKQLKEMGFTKTQITAILTAKKIKIKGIHSNVLLSSFNIIDSTNIGMTESQLYKKQTLVSTLGYIVSTVAMTLLAVNDVLVWGWFGAFLLAIKLIYVVAKSFTSYFNGYSDATINLKNHIIRKTDYLKMYKSSYEEQSRIIQK